MKKQSLFLIAPVLSFLFSFGQDTSQLKRPAYKLNVAVDKKTVYEEELKETPYVLPNMAVQLYPGETVYVEVEQENGVISKMTAVKEIVNPPKTITISFLQNANKRVHQSMMLKVANPFSQKLNYTAKIFLLKQSKWAATDVWPVEPGLSGFETWPDIIISIGLSNWKLQ